MEKAVIPMIKTFYVLVVFSAVYFATMVYSAKWSQDTPPADFADVIEETFSEPSDAGAPPDEVAEPPVEAVEPTDAVDLETEPSDTEHRNWRRSTNVDEFSGREINWLCIDNTPATNAPMENYPEGRVATFCFRDLRTHYEMMQRDAMLQMEDPRTFWLAARGSFWRMVLDGEEIWEEVYPWSAREDGHEMLSTHTAMFSRPDRLADRLRYHDSMQIEVHLSETEVHVFEFDIRNLVQPEVEAP